MGRENLSETETVTVTVRVPKGIIQFLNDIKGTGEFDTVEQYLEEAIISRVQADIENDQFNPTIEKVTEKYNLDKIFHPNQGETE